MQTPLPSNDDLVALSNALDWKEIEQQRRQFNQFVKDYAAENEDTAHLPLDAISECVGAPVKTYFDANDPEKPNILYIEHDGHQFVLR